MRILNCDWTGRDQVHILPQPGIAIVHGRNPVPTFGRHKRGTVDGHGAAVQACSEGDGLNIWNSWMRRGREQDGERVLSIGAQDMAHVENATDEGALHRAEVLAVEPHFSLIVDAVENQRDVRIVAGRWRCEFGAVPIFLPVQTLRDVEIVQSVIRIGIDAARNHGGQHRARHGCGEPISWC